VVQVSSLRQLMRGNVLVLTVSSILWSVSDSIVMAYFSLYILSLGGSPPIVGIINSVGSLAASVLYPIGGYIADKAGRAKLVGLSTLLYTSSFVVFAISPSWEWLAIAFAYQQIVLFYMPAINAIMADSIPIGARGKVYALTVGVPEAVRIVTPYFGGYLIAVLTLQPAMRLGYTLAFGIGMVVAFMRLRYLRETISSKEGVGRNVFKIFRESYVDVFGSMRWVFANLRGYAVIIILIALMGNFVMPFWIVFANEVVGLTPYDWGVILLMAGAVRTVMSFVIGSLVDRIGPKRCLIIGIAISVPSMALFVTASSFAQVAAIYLTLVVASAFAWIASSVYLADVIPRQMRGRVMAAVGQGVGLGVSGGGYASGFLVFIPMSIGSLASGFVYSLNPAYPWLIMSGALALALAVSVLLIKEPEKVQE